MERDGAGECFHQWLSSGGSPRAIDAMRAEAPDTAGDHQQEEEDGDGDEGDGEGSQRMQDEVYLYSLEKGFLMLRPDLRRKHGIVTANVTVSAHDICLGGRVIQVKKELGLFSLLDGCFVSG